VSLRAKRSNLIHNKIKHFEIAASLTLLAMTARIEFFHILLNGQKMIFKRFHRQSVEWKKAKYAPAP
jgi:hypothetical protein